MRLAAAQAIALRLLLELITSSTGRQLREIVRESVGVLMLQKQ